ncbi:hypothetical protein ABZ656_16345 [Streptomyces sp. NPDC007095]|jgi:hypothetical protein|uniref:hypothetical protein n=1 Tax=Streptomyces sp. NPDC007095 TaxID=3154482 RepID=UPI00101B5319
MVDFYIIGPDVTPGGDGSVADEVTHSTTTEIPRMNRSQVTGSVEIRPSCHAAVDGGPGPRNDGAAVTGYGSFGPWQTGT